MSTKWFGKGCEHLCGKWEENEVTGGPDYKESEPVLKFCNHEENPEDTEGNCRPSICPSGLKVIIAGSRSITDYSLIKRVMDELVRTNGLKVAEVVSGKARGVDTLGEQWANGNNIPVKPFPADWSVPTDPVNYSTMTKAGKLVVKTNAAGKKYNALGGFNRNEEMAVYGHALVLFWDGKSTGSADMLERANNHSLLVFEITTKGD